MFLLIPIIQFLIVSTRVGHLAADSRSLVMPNGGIFKFVVGYSIPVPVHHPATALLSHNFQLAYMGINNATMLHDLFQSGIQKGLQFSKSQVYSMLKQIMEVSDNYFWDECFLKAICELSETPLSHSGVIGSIVQHFFTPDPGDESSLVQAWEKGKSHGDCPTHYECPKSQDILDYFSLVKYF